jgi:beta-glucosidase
LYGRVNPGGKSPFTWGKQASDYGPDLIYEPTNGAKSPQDNFAEGNFIDYRAFDKNDITPTYEFGFGLSYTTFSYSNINVVKVPSSRYRPTEGMTQPAPVLGNFSKDPADYQWPANLTYVNRYIYPYLNSTNLKEASKDPQYGVEVELPEGSQDGSAQKRIPAGGAPGGNAQLWDVLYTVTATVTNTGKVAGEEVAQLYISLGGPHDPKVVLRNFDRLSIQAGQSATFTADITRRDVSNWDPDTQNWVITNYGKEIFVGSSSRSLPLSAILDTSEYN